MKCIIILICVLAAVTLVSCGDDANNVVVSRRDYSQYAKVLPQRRLRTQVTSKRYYRPYNRLRRPARYYYRRRQRPAASRKSPMGILSRSFHEFANLAVRGLREHARNIKVTDIIQFAPASGRHPAVEGRTKEESNVVERNEPDENSLPTVRLFTKFDGRGSRGFALNLRLWNRDYASFVSWLPQRFP